MNGPSTSQNRSLNTPLIAPECEAQLRRDAESQGVEKFVLAPFIMDEKERLLVLRRNLDEDFLPGFWEIPGGGLEAGERFEEALVRETKEETGGKVVAVGSESGTFDYLDGKGRKTRQYNFHVTLEQPFHPVLTEHCELAWIEKKEVGQFLMSEEMRQVVLSAWK